MDLDTDTVTVTAMKTIAKLNNKLQHSLRVLVNVSLPVLLPIFFATWSPSGNASAPLARIHAPGFYRFLLGDFEVTTLSDGTVDLPMSKLLVSISPADYQKAIARSFLTDPIETSLNAFLVNTGTQLILIDTGAGTLFGPTLGKLLSNLKASGYKPEQVDAILITHMHPDHVGGLTSNDKAVFANATVYADKAESDFWLNPENLAKAPAEKKSFFLGSVSSLSPYLKAGKLKPLPVDHEIVPGIRAEASHGHTPGHASYIVESKGQKLVLWGDLVHVAAVQFDKPSVRIQFDSDPKLAEAERRMAFADAAKQGYMIGAAHLAFPALGHIRSEKKAFVYVPVNYTR